MTRAQKPKSESFTCAKEGREEGEREDRGREGGERGGEREGEGGRKGGGGRKKEERGIEDSHIHDITTM